MSRTTLGAMRPVTIILLLTLSVVAPVAGQARINPVELLQTALEKLRAGEHSLARTYLAPALIAPGLSAEQRSLAYFLRGESFNVQRLMVSASKDYHRALEFNENNHAAQAALGSLYYLGRGVDENLPLALELFNSASADELAQAQFYLGHAHLNGRGVDKDITAAREWLALAAEQGYAPAMTQLGLSYRDPDATDADAASAQQWYEQAAQEGDTDAMVALAYMHADGELGEPDLTQSVALLEQAVERGSNNAAITLSHYYVSGTGVKEDTTKGFQLLQQAAQRGSAEAAHRLGYLYASGIGTEPDAAKSRAAYEFAARAGLSAAQMRLGLLLLDAEDDATLQQGKGWLKRAASGNDPGRHNDLAWVLATSRHDQVRDGAVALAYAQRAVAAERTPAFLDTLAAAYAEMGQFDDAITTQNEALALQEAELAEAAEPNTRLLEELRKHLAAYEAGQAWRE